MAFNGTASVNFSLLGRDFTANVPVVSEREDGFDIVIPAAAAGTLTARTDAAVGVVTLTGTTAPVPTFSVGDKVDVYFANGTKVNSVLTAVNMSAAPFTVTLSAGTGDDLPVLTTAVTVGKVVYKPIVIDPTAVQAFGLSASAPGVIRLQGASNAQNLLVNLTTAPGAYSWAKPSGSASPLNATAITQVAASNSRSTGTSNVSGLFMVT